MCSRLRVDVVPTLLCFKSWFPTLQNKFLDFLNVEVSARTISSKIVSAWGVKEVNAAGAWDNYRNPLYFQGLHFVGKPIYVS